MGQSTPQPRLKLLPQLPPLFQLPVWSSGNGDLKMKQSVTHCVFHSKVAFVQGDVCANDGPTVPVIKSPHTGGRTAPSKKLLHNSWPVHQMLKLARVLSERIFVVQFLEVFVGNPLR